MCQPSEKDGSPKGSIDCTVHNVDRKNIPKQAPKRFIRWDKNSSAKLTFIYTSVTSEGGMVFVFDNPVTLSTAQFNQVRIVALQCAIFLCQIKLVVTC